MNLGYARVSTDTQDLQLQLDALHKAGCEKIFSDKMSGQKRDRPGLCEAIAYARPGDCLVVWKLDRLGRSVKNLVDLATELEQRKIDLRSITDSIDTNGAAGRFFFHVMAALAEMERELIKERTQAGLIAAKKAGRIGGRPRSMTTEKQGSAKILLDGGMPAKDVAKSIGVSIATLYRWFPATSNL